MNTKHEILDIPRALRETLEKGRPEYEALVRQTRWGGGPIYMVGCGSSWLAGLVGAYAFESLLGWPVIARSPAVFETYTLAALRPRSVVLILSPSGESEEALAAAQAARGRGAVLLALTDNSTSPLGTMVDGVFPLRTGEDRGWGMRNAVCQQAAISYIGLVAARVLKRHHPKLDALEDEFAKLPGQVEWVQTQLQDAVRSFASELKELQSLCVVGGGFYHPTALQWALLLRAMTRLQASGFECSEFPRGPLESLGRDAVVVFLSGSRCRLKKAVHQAAALVKKAGARVFCSPTRTTTSLPSGRSLPYCSRR